MATVRICLRLYLGHRERQSQPVKTGNCLRVSVETRDSAEIRSIPEIPGTSLRPHSDALESPAAYELNDEHTETPLPPFVSSSEPIFSWGDMDGETFSCALNRIYNEIIHWKRNLFKVPSGKAGTAFVRELSRMFRAYADRSALESVALKAAMVMPALLFQKPHPLSKAKDHVLHLERRLQLWASGKLKDLLEKDVQPNTS